VIYFLSPNFFYVFSIKKEEKVHFLQTSRNFIGKMRLKTSDISRNPAINQPSCKANLSWYIRQIIF
jgi:hypothetical protein